MGLDVDPPAPPTLGSDRSLEAYEDVSVEGGGEYRRDELAAFLADGAWERAFDEWAEHTDLSREEYDILDDLDLFDEFDFFWDEFADRVGYHAPGLPEDWRERDLHPALDSWAKVSGINAAMTELGRVVSDLLKSEYVDWDADYEAPDDLPEFD
ncbi:hypothetical protein ACFQH6_09330 [Halobacteriaceae archaeon GCM10025711]